MPRASHWRARATELVGLVAVITTILLGCSTSPNASTTPSGPAGESPSATDGPAKSREPGPDNCRERIEAADLLNTEAMDAIDACRFTVEGFHAARDVLAAGGSDDVIWAAIWVYATGAYDPAPLRPILSRESPTLRVLAAAGLVALGDASGFDVLAASATNADDLSGSHPSISIREFVVGTFYRYVAADGAPGRWTTYEEFLTVDKRWADWVTANAARMAFDPDTGQWVLK